MVEQVVSVVCNTREILEERQDAGDMEKLSWYVRVLEKENTYDTYWRAKKKT